MKYIDYLVEINQDTNLDYYDIDCIKRSFDDGYGHLSSYDGHYYSEYINDEWFYVIRTD